jgi:hypothetical protein
MSAMLCLPASLSFSQSKFQIELGGGYVINMSENYRLGNYDNGWTIHFGASYLLAHVIALSGDFGYQRYPFGAELPIVELAANQIFAQSDLPDAQIYIISIGLRLMSPGKTVSPFISLMGGVAFERLQKVQTIFIVRGEPRLLQFRLAAENFTEGWFAVGLGAAVPIRSNLNWLIEGRFATSYHSNDVLPVTSSLQFKF